MLILTLTTAPFAADTRPSPEMHISSLPEGAIRRLGSTAYRLPARCKTLAWSEDRLQALTFGGVASIGPDGETSGDEARRGAWYDLSEDGSLAAVLYDDEVRVLRRNGREKILYGAGGDIVDAAWLPDGRLVALSHVESTIGCITLDTDGYLSVWGPHQRRPRQIFLRNCVGDRLAPFGAGVAVACDDRFLLVDPKDEESPEILLDERPLNLWGSDSQTLILSTRSGYEIRQGESVERGRAVVSAAAARGSAVALGGERFIKLHGASPRTIPLEDGVVSALAWHPDERAIAACVGYRVGWWNAETGEALTPFVGHAESVTAVALSSDGRRAVSGSRAGDVIVWDTQSGSVLARFLFPEVAAVYEVAWDEGIVNARAGVDGQQWVVDPDWAPGPPRSYRIEGQQDGTVLLFEAR